MLRAQFGLGLALKNRFLNPYGNGCAYTSPYVGRVVIFFIKIADRFNISLAKSRQVCTALGGELAVHKAVIFFAVTVFMGKGHFNIVALQVNDGIPYFIFIGFPLQQVEQAILADVPFVVEVHHQAGIEVTIIPELVIEVFLYKMEVLKHRFIGNESDKCAILLFGRNFFGFLFEHTFFKFGKFLFAFAVRRHFKVIAESIYCLCTHSVEAHTFLKRLAVVFGAGVYLAHHVHYFSQRNTTAIIPYGDGFARNIHIHVFAVAHGMFINTVVYYFFEEHVNTIVRTAAVTQFSDIHTGP